LPACSAIGHSIFGMKLLKLTILNDVQFLPVNRRFNSVSFFGDLTGEIREVDRMLVLLFTFWELSKKSIASLAGISLTFRPCQVTRKWDNHLASTVPVALSIQSMLNSLRKTRHWSIEIICGWLIFCKH
jgi:hypothetical protein